MLVRRTTMAVIATAALTLFGACGDTDDGETADDTGATADGGTTEGTTDDTSGEQSLEFTALDIEWERDEASAAAGELEVSLVNDGEIEHTWLVEEHEDELKLEVTSNGDTDEGTITLEPGTYTYYCDVPGHRAAGMEGELTLE